jgi:hypothetical protein
MTALSVAYRVLAGLTVAVASAQIAAAAPVEDGLLTESSSTASVTVGASTDAMTVDNQNTTSASSGSTTTSYTAQVFGSPDVASSSSTAAITLSNPSAGLLELSSNASLDLVTPGAVGAAHTGGNTGEVTNYASYDFTESRPFTLSFTYLDSQSGSQTGYFGPYVNSQGGSAIGPGTLPTNGSGAFSQSFGAGYLQIEFYDDIYSADALSSAAPAALTSTTDYKLSFTITDVPEPAAWSLMLVGSGILGGALRTRRRSLAVA